MSLLTWILSHVTLAAFWLWILSFGGAEKIEGWKSFFIIGWFAALWTAEQLRLYALCILVLQVPWFIAGLLIPQWRGFAV